MGNKATPVPITEDAAAEYYLMHSRVKELVMTLVGRKFAVQEPNEPRTVFLADLEVGRIDARVELNAVARILMELLEIKGPTVFAYINDELGLELARLEEEVDSTGTPGNN